MHFHRVLTAAAGKTASQSTREDKSASAWGSLQHGVCNVLAHYFHGAFREFVRRLQLELRDGADLGRRGMQREVLLMPFRGVQLKEYAHVHQSL